MKNILSVFILLSAWLLSENILSEVQKNGILIQDKNAKEVKIHRKQNPLCEKYLNVDSLFPSNDLGEKGLQACSKRFVTQIGTLQPMQLSSKIQTVGELELLSHIKKSQEDKNAYILIDARAVQWFDAMTIPTAMNLPFTNIHYDADLEADDFEDENDFEDYEEAYQKMFTLLNIKKTKEGLDFSKAKSAVIFCNGSWCSQSPKAIYKLINLGYPAEKILWYRGGLQDWLIYDFPVEKKNEIVYP